MEFLRMAMAMICNNSSTFNLIPSKISSNIRCISSNNQDSLLLISNSNFISNNNKWVSMKASISMGQGVPCKDFSIK